MSDWKSNFIRDGVSQDGFIAEVDGLHGSISFKYRPMLGQHAELYADAIEKAVTADPEKGYLKMVDVVAEYLQEWDQPAELNKENVRRLKQRLMIRIYRIIRGDNKSDDRPGLDLASTGDQILGKS
ncbi:MAG: hypothetical protein ACK5XN_09605 [Bacteroidota bacterium]